MILNIIMTCLLYYIFLLEKKCFKPALQNVDDPIIPITVKFRAKIRSDQLINKLKAQGCMRGDLQAELTDLIPGVQWQDTLN